MVLSFLALCSQISFQILLSVLRSYTASAELHSLNGSAEYRNLDGRARKNILLISGDEQYSFFNQNIDKRTHHISWNAENRVAYTSQIERILSTYEMLLFETPEPLISFLEIKKYMAENMAKIIYISYCTHFILPKNSSIEANITKCGPQLYIARQLDMIMTPSRETSKGLLDLDVKAMFYPNWSLRKVGNADGGNLKLNTQNYMSLGQLHSCEKGGIFVSYGSRGGRKARDMRKVNNVLRLAKKGINSALCAYEKARSCELFRICEQCSPERYVQLLKCMGILLLPLGTDVSSKIESGRGLRTIISALEHRVNIITGSTPYTRDYLSNYTCATLLPINASAKYYLQQVRSTLEKRRTRKLCILSEYPHDFRAETALPNLLDMLSDTF